MRLESVYAGRPHDVEDWLDTGRGDQFDAHQTQLVQFVRKRFAFFAASFLVGPIMNGEGIQLIKETHADETLY